jgi:hypothetical protein
MLSHSFQLLRPFAFELSVPPLHLRSSAFRRRSCRGLASPSRALPVRGGTHPGAQSARMGRAGVCRKDPRRRFSPRRTRRRAVRALCLLPLLWVGAADLAFLPAAARGARPPTSMPYGPLHPLGGHLCPPVRDVHGVALLLPAPGRKGVAQRPSGDGKRAKLRLHLSHDLHCILQRPHQLLPELHQHLMVRLHELV